MKYITYENYKKYTEKLNVKIQYPKDKIYNRNNLEKIYKRHDKMFKTILSKKTEMANFLKQFLCIDTKIRSMDLIQCPTEIITKNYKEKYADIIYKSKKEPVYFLIEHQSTVDKNMLERIGTYVEEIMKREIKNNIYPRVVPIVIYTGLQKWTSKTNIRQKQYQSEKYEKYEMNLEYNLIDVKKYTEDQLLKGKTLIGSAMLLEKCKTVEEIDRNIKKIIKIAKEENKEILKQIIANFIEQQIGEEKKEEMIKKLKEGDEKGMSPLMKTLLDLEYKGKIEGIKNTVKKMLQFKETDEKIMKYTGISKEDLKNIKKALAQ